ncbi:hypothetical protein QBC47DRAFT_395238 [Echria macrotheca]|uniref:SMP-30/Gluconolactonase/LRE-like region domain-containing protein n=1 Tax=Echria macrotheca TaxID=438768 RepID=A0AAJ0B1F9_9PEZI|nr:hypothetical protein QBC47DRAFT_395238 [Echria macrotheca]
MTTKVVFQLPNIGTFFENIAVSADGSLLTTRVDAPEVWRIDPKTGEGSLLLTLPAPLRSATGIAELAPSVFALGAGIYDMTPEGGGPVPGSMEFWTFEFITPGDPVQAQSTLRRVCAVPEAVLLNGLCKWDDTTAIGVDSGRGTVYKVDIVSGTCETILQDDLTAPSADFPVPIGINGIKRFRGHLYFTNSSRMSLYRVPVDQRTARPTGPVELVASGFACDDFAVSEDGISAYVATHATHMVVRVALDPAVAMTEGAVTVAGSPDSLDLGGSTSCAFGRGETDRRTLYVTTSGALSFPVGGTMVEPAKVAAVEV